MAYLALTLAAGLAAGYTAVTLTRGLALTLASRLTNDNTAVTLTQRITRPHHKERPCPHHKEPQ